MTKKDQDLLDSTIESLEMSDEEVAQREDELIYMTERLCEMSKTDFRKYMLYIRFERKARKHLGDMSKDA